MNAEDADLVQYLTDSSVADFIEAAEIFSSIGIKLERERGTVSFSPMGSHCPHAAGQAEIGHQVDMWIDYDFDFFWSGTNAFLAIDDSVIVPDVSAGPSAGPANDQLTTFACEVSDRNPVTQERIDTYYRHAEVQYLLVIRIGWYENGRPATLTSLKAELYDVPNRSRIGNVDVLQCTQENQAAMITLPRARLYQGAPIPPNARDFTINLYRVKRRIETGIRNI